jgi:hypothetical protein
MFSRQQKSKIVSWLPGAIIALIVVWFAWGSYSDYTGPSAAEAFERYLADPIPTSVSNLVIRHTRHFQGRNIFLVFNIDPSDLQKIIHERQFDVDPGAGMSFHLETVQAMDSGTPITDTDGTFYQHNATGVRESLVVSGDSRKAYFWHGTDPDFQ